MREVDIFNIGGIRSKVCPRCTRMLPLTDFARDLSKSDGRTSHCKKCRNDYKQLRRSLDPDNWRRYANIQSDHARALVREAIKNGQLKRPGHCEACKEKCIVEGHHRDYSKPLEVVWLCKDCHAFVHSSSFTFHGNDKKEELNG